MGPGPGHEESLEGSPGEAEGEPVGEGEVVIPHGLLLGPREVRPTPTYIGSGVSAHLPGSERMVLMQPRSSAYLGGGLCPPLRVPEDEPPPPREGVVDLEGKPGPKPRTHYCRSTPRPSRTASGGGTRWPFMVGQNRILAPRLVNEWAAPLVVKIRSK